MKYLTSQTSNQIIVGDISDSVVAIGAGAQAIVTQIIQLPTAAATAKAAAQSS